MPTQKIPAELRRSIRDSLRAYTKGSAEFFDYLTDDVRVFILDSSQPIAGKTKFKNYYGPTLNAVKRKVKVLSEDVQPAGEQVILSQLLQISAEGVGTNVRQTVVWTNSAGAWKMAHIHNARVGEPIALGRPPLTAAGVRVLNERIAVAASAVGVAQ